MWHRSSHIWIINDKNEILVQKRNPYKQTFPNLWAISVAGHVDSGEGIDDTALREVEEEIGLKLSLNDLHVLNKMEVKKRESNSHLTRIYYVICNEERFTVQTEELSDVRWFNIDDVMEMINSNDESLTLKADRLYLLEKLKEIDI